MYKRQSFDSCTDDGDCARNHACVGGSCRRWCDYVTDEGCGLGEICARVSPRILLNGVEYGFCDFF